MRVLLPQAVEFLPELFELFVRKLFEIDELVASRFWVFWIKNTIRNVMMVVPVLMTSCHVSEK